VTCAKLGIRITHSPPYRPEGRGKIVRYLGFSRSNLIFPQVMAVAYASVTGLRRAA